MLAWRLIIRGRVQGVGYRFAMAEVAEALGVAGWVRNRRDGTVEAFVQGAPAAVDAVIAWCGRGPPSAQVTAITTTAVEADPALDTFEHRQTEP
jgi:acylphosphatase